MTPEDTSWQRWYRIEPEAGFTPGIGRLVQMLAYARMTTEHAVQGLSVEDLDAVPPGFTNSIGMLLAHVAATDRIYQFLSFEGRDPITEDTPAYRPFVGAMTFGEQGERVQGRTLEELLGELREVRAATLAELRTRDDAWLASLLPGDAMGFANQHWAWFHVLEDEVSHRGQIRLLRKAIEAGKVEAPKQP